MADLEGIVLTADAVKHVQQYAKESGFASYHARAGVKGGGCAGYEYVFEISDGEGKRETDREYIFEDVKLYVDHKSYELLKGTTIDYVKTLMRTGFQFKNPNFSSTCGCGNSFG